MPTITTTQLPKFVDDKEFERFCLRLWEKQYPNHKVEFAGRDGQNQRGVDILVDPVAPPKMTRMPFRSVVKQLIKMK